MIGGISMSNIYTSPRQNNFEEIAQGFGRFFHSPLYFDTQLPYFGTFLITANASGSLSIGEENADYVNGTSISTVSDGTSRHFSIDLEIGSILKMYSPYISPAYLIDGGTTYRMVPCIEDSSILVRIYSSSGSTFDTWNPGSGNHPFGTTQEFYISFYGKRI